MRSWPRSAPLLALLLAVPRVGQAVEPAPEVPPAAMAEAGAAQAIEASSQPVAVDPATTAQIERAIRQLGDGSFAARKRASKELVEIGIAAEPQLTTGLADDDAEVRSRCAQVLSEVVEADFRARLEAFANDPLGTQQHSLPCWAGYSQIFGQGEAARALFVEMQRGEPALLEALDADSKVAAELLMLRMQALLPSVQWPQAGGAQPAIRLGTICALLFVSSSDAVALGDQEAVQLYNLVLQSSFQSNLRTAAAGPVLKKMLGRWILHNSGSAIAFQNLQLAFNCDLPEGLDLAIKMIGADGGGQPFMRQYVLLAIGRFGDHEQIPLVEPLLKDTNPCMPQQNQDPRQSQIRDVALAVLIKLSGQELKDYGLEHIQPNSQTLFQPGTIAFASPERREAALKKWAQWAKHHEEVAPDTAVTDKTSAREDEAAHREASRAKNGSDDATPGEGTPGAATPGEAASDEAPAEDFFSEDADADEGS